MGISGEMHAFLTGESSRLILALTNPLFYTGIITKIINVQYRTLKGSIKYMKINCKVEIRAVILG